MSSLSSACTVIAEFLKVSRLKADLTTSEVAEYLELPEALIKAYEGGTKPVPIEDLLGLSNLLNIPPAEVVSLFYDLLMHRESKVFSGQRIS
jgi:transcriptional regulator with XRE-family HTH domain